MRKFYYISIKHSLKVFQGAETHHFVTDCGITTIDHNLTGLHDLSCARSLRIIKPLSVIETYKPLSIMPELGGTLYDLDYSCDAKVLTIGPRTEGEIYCLMAHGFKPKNIKGLDLISYSPYIDIGDMHHMTYANDAFDIVIASCVLIYSTNPKLACDEILRVTKDNGLICIAQDTDFDMTSAHINATGKSTLSTEDYLDFFKGHVKKVFFDHEIPQRLNENKLGTGSCYTCSLIFQIDKSG